MLAFVVAGALMSQAASDAVTICEARLKSYAGWTATMSTVWAMDEAARGGGRLVYLGVEHSRDPSALQFQEIKTAFDEARPTVVFYEGPDRGIGADGPDSITTRGESGYVRWLASTTGATTRPLEPSPIALFEDLAEDYPADQVELFFVLREATRLRDREKLEGQALDEAVATLLGRLRTMSVDINLPFSDLAGLEAAYAEYWTRPADWRTVPANWFDPVADDAETGGRFMAALNAASSERRNVHMYRVLAEAALSGEQVFAIVGRNHVPMQEDALRCALGQRPAF